MAYERIQCSQTNCRYGTSHCCFGEYDPKSFDGKQITERHKCKRNKKEYVFVTIIPNTTENK